MKLRGSYLEGLVWAGNHSSWPMIWSRAVSHLVISWWLTVAIAQEWAYYCCAAVWTLLLHSYQLHSLDTYVMLHCLHNYHYSDLCYYYHICSYCRCDYLKVVSQQILYKCWFTHIFTIGRYYIHMQYFLNTHTLVFSSLH